MKLNLIFFFIACSLSFNQKQTPHQSYNGENFFNNLISAKDTTPIISWQVKGCAEKAAKGNTKFPSSGEYNDYPDLPMPGDNGISAEGDSIVYSRFVRHGCCRKVEVSTKLHEKIITIIEYWSGRICKCMYSSTIKSVIRKLPKGEYHVYGIETGTDPVDDKPTNGRDTVMSQQVTIK